MSKIKNVCCIGAGYVGGPTMTVMALKNPDINFNVVDLNKDRIDSWNNEDLNKLPIYEPGLNEILKRVRNKNLFFSTAIEKAILDSEIIFIAVNTPTKTSGEGKGMASDLKYFKACARDIKKYSKGFKIIVEKSTVPVQTADKIKEIFLEGGKSFDFEILSNPEFLAEGTAINDMLNPNRVLIGGDISTSKGKNSIKILSEIYESWVPKNKILTTNVWSSELAKLASNAMLAQRVSSINSLSALCEVTGANITELSKAIGMDQRIGSKFLNSSPGFGGSCFQKDILNLVYISKSFGLNEVAQYWNQVLKINDYQRRRIADIVINAFDGDITNKNIFILGWAFKSNTDDTRESSSIIITEILYSLGAKISILDPQVKKGTILNDINQNWKINYNHDITFYKDNLSIIDSDAAIILTEWEEFKSINFDKNCKVFDSRNLLKEKDTYYRLGVKS